MGFENGRVKFGDKTYNAVGMIRNKIVLECENRFGIYYTDIKRTTITRNISKTGTIRLEGSKLDVMGIEGVASHLKGAKC